MKPLERMQDFLSKLYRLAPPRVWISVTQVMHRIKVHLFSSKAVENRKCRTLVSWNQNQERWICWRAHLDKGAVPLAANGAKLGLKQAAPEISDLKSVW